MNTTVNGVSAWLFALSPVRASSGIELLILFSPSKQLEMDFTLGAAALGQSHQGSCGPQCSPWPALMTCSHQGVRNFSAFHWSHWPLDWELRSNTLTAAYWFYLQWVVPVYIVEDNVRITFYKPICRNCGAETGVSPPLTCSIIPLRIK